MNFEISEQERNLLLELIESAEEGAIQGMDHADSRSFKDLLRKRLELLASAKEKIRKIRGLTGQSLFFMDTEQN